MDTIFVIGYAAIPQALHRLAGDIEAGIGPLVDEVGERGAALYQQQIEEVDAIDSRHFIDTVRARTARRRLGRDIKSDASYSGVVEEGWTDRARGQESYPGRFPALRAVELMGPIIEDAADHQFGRHRR